MEDTVADEVTGGVSVGGTEPPCEVFLCPVRRGCRDSLTGQGTTSAGGTGTKSLT